MGKRLQIYYSAIFGALGGLAGWWIVGSVPTQTWGIWAAALGVGGGLGLALGGLVAATDGAMIKRKAQRALRDGLLGALAGMVAGALGMLLAQLVFLALRGGWEGRALSWMLLGGLIGASDLLVSRRPRRAAYATLGGLAGGLAGGLLYEGLTQLFLASSGSSQIWIGGLGLIMIGAAIGASIPLARQVFAQAELRVVRGEQSGLVREVSDRTSIGQYDGNDLYLPDAGIAWHHAEVRRTSSGFELAVLAGIDGTVRVGEKNLGPGERQALRSGDRIVIGRAELEFVGT